MKSQIITYKANDMLSNKFQIVAALSSIIWIVFLRVCTSEIVSLKQYHVKYFYYSSTYWYS